jgi:lysozyme family protein
LNFRKKIGVTADGAFGPGTLKAAAAYYKLSPNRAAHFFAQCAHESGNFKAFSENLNYGAKGLRGIFGKYFPTDALAKAYERQPQRLPTASTPTAWAMATKRQAKVSHSRVEARSNSPGRTTTAHLPSTSGANRRFWIIQTLWLRTGL